MKRMLVHRGSKWVQIAFLEHGKLNSLAVESAEQETVVKNIYKGRVIDVLPGLQAAFVDIGLNKNAYLSLDQLLNAKKVSSITELLKPGQEIMIQIMKEPTNNKGARLTEHITLPGRFLVYMPYDNGIKVSQRIERADERNRLRKLLEKVHQPNEGIIVRTAAENVSLTELEADLNFLRKRWKDLCHRNLKSDAPSLLFKEDPLHIRAIRDLFSFDTEEVIIDHEETAEYVKDYLHTYAPKLFNRVKIYQESLPLFEKYKVEKQIQQAFQRKVWLKNGGYLVFDETEAITVIDVNTGKYVGNDKLEETVYHTNLLAAEEIAHLIQLRDTGGIIVIDFIDMQDLEHREDVLAALEKHTRHHAVKCVIAGWTKLGLVEMTRKREHGSNYRHALKECTHCKGTGKIVSFICD